MGEATRLAEASIGCEAERPANDGRAGAQHQGWLAAWFSDVYPPLVEAPAGALLAGFFGPPHL
jgi:hypothetical protein